MTLGYTAAERTTRGITGTTDPITGVTSHETIILYLPGSLVTSGNNLIKLHPETRAIFYVHGNITGASSSSDNAFGNSGNAENLQIYKYGTGSVTFSAISTIINGFLFAPFASTTLSGGGKIRGAIWTNTWTSIGNFGVIQGITNPLALKVSTPAGANNSISISSWQRQN